MNAKAAVGQAVARALGLFTLGEGVAVKGVVCPILWDVPGGTEMMGSVCPGEAGEVVEGPDYPSDTGAEPWWFKVSFDNGMVGWVAEDYLQLAELPPPAAWNIDDLVEVVPIGSAAVFDTPSGNLIGGQEAGGRGVIVGGPEYVGGTWWWNVDFEAGQDGWVAEAYLQLVELPPPTEWWVVAFSDDFNRPDATVVGNGWLSSFNPVGDAMEIKNNELTLTSTLNTSEFVGVYHYLGQVFPVNVTIRQKENNGFGGIGGRYVRQIRLGSNGNVDSGYGIFISSSDSTAGNSNISVVNGTTILNTLYSPFQYGSEIDVEATWYPDGSISGTVTDPNNLANVFSFSFGPYAFGIDGDNLLLATTATDNRASELIFPRMDDLVVSVPSSEPVPW